MSNHSSQLLLDSEPSTPTRYFMVALKPEAAQRYPRLTPGKPYRLEFLLPGETIISPAYRYLAVDADPSAWVRVRRSDINIVGLM